MMNWDPWGNTTSLKKILENNYVILEKEYQAGSQLQDNRAL